MSGEDYVAARHQRDHGNSPDHSDLNRPAGSICRLVSNQPRDLLSQANRSGDAGSDEERRCDGLREPPAGESTPYHHRPEQNAGNRETESAISNHALAPQIDSDQAFNHSHPVR